MFRKISLTALALASAVALAPNANASTATGNVSFSQTVAGSCTLSAVTNGTLLYNGGNALKAGMGTGNGTPGSVSLKCNESSSLTLSDPTNNGSSTGASVPMNTQGWSFAQVSLPNSGGTCYSPQASFAGYTSSPNCSSVAAGTTTLSVAMLLNFLYKPAPATYNYSTTLTATYN